MSLASKFNDQLQKHGEQPAASGVNGDEVRQKLRKRVDELLGQCNRISEKKRPAAVPVKAATPVVKTPEATAPVVASPAKTERSQPTGPSHRALVVEGNPLHRKVLVRALEKAGYEVDVLDSAVQAVEVFQRCPYGIVLLDCDTPEIEGYRLAANLRMIEGEACHTPIVGLTGNAGQAHRRERKAAGIDNYLLKPFRRDRVEAVVSRYSPNRTPGPASQFLALDKDRVRELQELASDDPTLLQELIDLFLTSAPELLEQMRRAAEDEESSDLRHAAHILKGSSGQMGAVRMEEMCGMIETLAGTGSLVAVDSLLSEVSLAFERAVAELRLLRSALPESADGEAVNQAPPAKPPAQTNEILLAEDDMLIARFLTSSLSASGFHVTHVRDGTAALETLRDKSFAVVILDINMPEMDGYQVLSEIRSRVGESTPVAIISSRHQEQDVLRAFDLGVDDYLTKPFNPSEVVARVKRLARR